MSSHPNIIKLNIGGTVFQTTRTTLTKYDGFFKTMLETAVPNEIDDSGCFFVDRSPKYFDMILNFMRDGEIELPDCLKELKEIEKEAQYFLLAELVDFCQNKRENVTKDADFVNFKILKNLSEEFLAVANAKKPVAIISIPAEKNFVDFKPTIWEELVTRKSNIWDIYFKINEKSEFNWKFHYNRHPGRESGKNTCRYNGNQCEGRDPYGPDHIKYHMNDFLREIF